MGGSQKPPSHKEVTEDMRRTRLSAALAVLLILLLWLTPVSAAASAQLQLEVEKTLIGDKPVSQETFTFLLEPVGDAPMPEENTVTITGSGTVTFPPITYDAPEDYHYTLRELPGETWGYTYDDTVYLLTVQVTTDDAGNLTATLYLSREGSEGKADKIAFINRYRAPRPDTPEEPVDPDDTTPPVEPEPQPPTDSVDTGDESFLGIWITLCVLAVCGLAGTALLFIDPGKKKSQ